MWEKKGLDELDCHVPFMVRVPWLPGEQGFPPRGHLSQGTPTLLTLFAVRL